MNSIYLTSEYLLKALISPSVIDEMNERSTGSSYLAINDANFKRILIPVTSSDMQNKITATIEKLNQKLSQLD